MEYVLLGKTGVRVSELCLGTMTFGNEAGEEASVAIMERAFEAGVNFFDTANVYNEGRSEEIIGRWMGARREDIVLATKATTPTGSGPNERGSSRRHVTLSVEKSLRRLQTDWIDILYLHLWDEHCVLEESMAALNTLVEQGKILYPAVSNYAAWQTVDALRVCERRNLASITTIQPMYNLVKRQAEVEILPMAQAHRLAVCPYSPMGAGLLSGKYLRGETGRLDVNERYKKRYGDPDYPEVSKRFIEHARARGESPAALALAWVLNHPAVTSPIIGARNVEQLDDALTAVQIDLPPEEREAISALSPEPPLATDREK